MTRAEMPWLAFYNGVPETLNYYDGSLYDAVKRSAEQVPTLSAFEFMDRSTTYSKLMDKIDHFASCLYKAGVRKNDKVMICLPNCPQALYAYYGVSKCGAISVMIHPLSAKNEIAFYLQNSKSKIAITLDTFLPNFLKIKNDTILEKIIVADLKDELGFLKGLGYSLTIGRKNPKVPDLPFVIRWKDFCKLSNSNEMPKIDVKAEDPASILYSGGTTGKSKGILLSNKNINATSQQTLTASQCSIKDYRTMLSVMPMFHGFGLCIGIHMFLSHTGKCILVPKFTPKSYAELIMKKKPNYIAGVPTLFEHMIRVEEFQNADLSCLKGVFVGGDSLTIELRAKMSDFLSKHGCNTTLREGYGLTECVTASCLTPKDVYKEGSIGIPFPDTLYKIVKKGTQEAVPFGEEGEICISGPSVMIEYVDEAKETAETLQVHPDGNVWLHSGDLGLMDKDGFVYFKQRFKRMIISSGYNIYPNQIENILDAHPAVLCSCVIGIPDEIKKEIPKAFIVLNKDIEPNDKLIEELKAYCLENMARYAMPRHFEFLKEIPKTKVGKVAYTELLAKEKERLGIK